MSRWIPTALLAAVLAIAVTAPAAAQAARPAAPRGAVAHPAAAPARLAIERPIPYPVVPPQDFQRAVAQGTRTTTGAPGASYWQQYARYRTSARLDVPAKTLSGSTHVVYLNRSPDTLRVLYVQTLQNFHSIDAPRFEAAEITGGMQFTRVAAAGQPLQTTTMRMMYGPGQNRAPQPGYRVAGTTLMLRPAQALLPHDSVALDFEWSFKIPQDGVNGRMGWDRDNLFYLAYWYPQMAVYDDVVGWQTDAFLGNAEFYDGFADYDVTLDAPEGWLVSGTGELANAGDVLPDAILQRLRQAEASDSVVHVLTADDFGPGRTTKPVADGRVRWHF
ncbi:MAG: M1 family peptidase, partial [Gemmatimonadales bacterium]